MKYKREEVMGRKRSFLGFFATLFVAFFTANAFAAGYSCPSYKKYTSCNAGYYLNGTEPGNTCASCPDNSTNTNSQATFCICDTGYSVAGATTTTGTACSANTYTVSYNKNKPTNATGTVSGATANSTHTYGIAKNLTANGFSLVGWTFGGWNTNANGTGTSYADKASVKNLTTTYNATVPLYAKWTAKKNTVSFDVNGGSGGQTANVTATYDSAMPTISTTKPTKAGCKFNGWYDATSGGTQYYTAAGASARTWNKTADTKLYAQWSCMTVSAPAKTLTYNGTNTSNGTAQSCATTFTVTGPSSYTVTYSSSSTGTYSATAPTQTNAGTTTVYYKVDATDYTTYSGSYTCTMNNKAMTVS
ncbi:MAG: InlB B-repeat-containing protein, partial [Alphaproteobacteria bacterium]|nr:InlB B-repeat-containing protein [Alphaproteobacteria bacterium]